ncbi:RhoGAP domain-containing protein [Naegleria gruberi]|uniref:RhoGAP domain-containing protein n=1 Tax=Naegleria gruberi TaxID=5762 RepID=D2VEW2_NAEGR|nr:RhoGAP domain-containing protein [Naegleria gruberi]EFC44672.1 RhoGAP domain-containing protein [Naegleria gruberi]|eukprot:XP_002677416.1 RhoGAP domain-containing protein [Naegleria gruberi strain NEG-M]
MKIASFFKLKQKSFRKGTSSSGENTPTTPTTPKGGKSKHFPSASSSSSICSTELSTSENYPNSVVFGHPLPEDMNLIPKFVCSAIIYLTQNGLDEEGLFRVSTMKDSLDSVISQLENDVNMDIDFSKHDVHLPAALIKIYFRELSDPLLSFDCYGMFIAAERIPEERARLETIKKVIQFLPKHYFNTLKMLCDFLRLVSLNSSKNKMTADNLAIVFAPNILRDRGELDVMDLMRHAKWINHLTKTLIEYTEYIFGNGTLPDDEAVEQAPRKVSVRFAKPKSIIQTPPIPAIENDSQLMERLATLMEDQESNDEKERMARRRQTLERRVNISTSERKKTIEKMVKNIDIVSNTSSTPTKQIEEEVSTPKKSSTPVVDSTPSPSNTEATKKVKTPKVKKDPILREIQKAVQRYLCSNNIFGVNIEVSISEKTVNLSLSGFILSDTSCDLNSIVERLQSVTYYDPVEFMFDDVAEKLGKQLGKDFSFNVTSDSLHDYDIMLDECSTIMLISCLHAMTKYFFETCDDPKLDDQFFVDWILCIFPTLAYYPYYHMVLFCLLIRSCYKKSDTTKLALLLKPMDQHPFSIENLKKQNAYEDDKITNYDRRAILISKMMGGKNPFFKEYNPQLDFAKHFGFIVTEVLLRDAVSENPICLFEDFSIHHDVGSVARVRTFDKNETVLFDAIRVPDIAVIQYLIEECLVDVNCVNQDGISPLTLSRILYSGMIKEEIDDYLTFVGAKEIKPQNIDSVTHDMWRKIFEFLEVKEIATWCQVSKNFYGINVIDNEKLWMDIFTRIKTVETVAFNPFHKLQNIMQTRECKLSWRCLAEFKHHFKNEDITYFIFNEKDRKHKDILDNNTVLMNTPPSLDSAHFISLLLFIFNECNLDDSMLQMYEKIKASKKSEKSMLRFIEEQISHHAHQLTNFVFSMQNIAVKREMYKEKITQVLYYSVLVDNYWYLFAYNTKHKVIGVVIVDSNYGDNPYK